MLLKKVVILFKVAAEMNVVLQYWNVSRFKASNIDVHSEYYNGSCRKIAILIHMIDEINASMEFWNVARFRT